MDDTQRLQLIRYAPCSHTPDVNRDPRSRVNRVRVAHHCPSGPHESDNPAISGTRSDEA